MVWFCKVDVWCACQQGGMLILVPIYDLQLFSDDKFNSSWRGWNIYKGVVMRSIPFLTLSPTSHTILFLSTFSARPSGRHKGSGEVLRLRRGELAPARAEQRNSAEISHLREVSDPSGWKKKGKERKKDNFVCHCNRSFKRATLIYCTTSSPRSELNVVGPGSVTRTRTHGRLSHWP